MCIYVVKAFVMLLGRHRVVVLISMKLTSCTAASPVLLYHKSLS
jgi:hypothetical protein